ncbi:S1 RNA-binding domain-containing protein 1-like isoform X1 [Stegodyphus dumicola]|uniref:S1 RNA-binding domain-containing protein 1-like isoform X1 n=1 Tax=Stegodyphus dumicola TaxID=202533 RepID=UPI0015B1E557|nr:S1 RNA-binding domain-containing protein 1-like isoform X1 [Stegodyphus dumicola]
MPRLRERKPKIKVEDVDDDLSNDDDEASGDNDDTDYEPVPQKQLKRKRNVEDELVDEEVAATEGDTNSVPLSKSRRAGNKSAPKPRTKKIKSEQLYVNDEQESSENSNLKAKRTLPQSKKGRKKVKVEKSIEKNEGDCVSSDLQPFVSPNEDVRISKTEEKEETGASNPPSTGQSSCDTVLKTCQQQSFTRGKVGEAWKDEEVVAEATNVDVWIAKNVITLLDEDCSIPFIVRYRKEMTGGLQAEKLREIQASYDEVKIVHKKVENILKSVKDERLDENLVASFLSAKTLEEVELLYAPFKPGNKKTLAERSKKLGLEPIALQILEMKTSLSNAKLSSFVKSQKGKCLICISCS